MKYYRSLALAAAIAGGLALPALAQTAAPDTTPAPKAESPTAVPDAGVRKAVPSHAKPVHHARHRTVKAAPAPTGARK